MKIDGSVTTAIRMCATGLLRAAASTPPRYEIATEANIIDDLLTRVATTPERPAFARPNGAGWTTVTWHGSPAR